MLEGQLIKAASIDVKAAPRHDATARFVPDHFGDAAAMKPCLLDSVQ
jgi:ABC-type antimicrobial peptide transport system ATPase subunit